MVNIDENIESLLGGDLRLQATREESSDRVSYLSKIKTYFGKYAYKIKSEVSGELHDNGELISIGSAMMAADFQTPYMILDGRKREYLQFAVMHSSHDSDRGLST
jgi:hypothetical protein